MKAEPKPNTKIGNIINADGVAPDVYRPARKPNRSIGRKPNRSVDRQPNRSKDASSHYTSRPLKRPRSPSNVTTLEPGDLDDILENHKSMTATPRHRVEAQHRNETKQDNVDNKKWA